MIETIVCIYLLAVLLNVFFIRRLKAGKWVINLSAKATGVTIFYKQNVTTIRNVIDVKEIVIDRTDLLNYRIEVDIITPPQDSYEFYQREPREFDEREKMSMFKAKVANILPKIIAEHPAILRKFIGPDQPHTYSRREVWMLDIWFKENGR